MSFQVIAQVDGAGLVLNVEGRNELDHPCGAGGLVNVEVSERTSITTEHNLVLSVGGLKDTDKSR